MLDHDTRTAVLRLREEGHGTRAIARALGISRDGVKAVLKAGDALVPPLDRPSAFTAHVDRVRALHVACRGNLVRVHEELGHEGVEGSYAALTRFCRLHGIGVLPPVAVGRYTFGPGEEMQHDTSPHGVTVGGRRRLVQCASLVLCHSRMRFCQAYPTYNRFYAKVFLTGALTAFGGAAGRCMIDNTSVVLAGGSGRDAIIAPEMTAFAERFGFAFEAHAVGHAKRSSRVERPFHHIENNFYPGRTFADLADLNAQMRAWCDEQNATFRRTLQASPRDLFAAEHPRLRPPPLHVPEVYAIEHRVVDTSGEVHLHTNRYSVPDAWIGRRVEILASMDVVRIAVGHVVVAEHARLEDGARARSVDPTHRTQPRHLRRRQPLREERDLEAAGPEFAAMVVLLRGLHRGRAVRAVRRLHRLYIDYPTEPVRQALATAIEFGLSDLGRIERMVIRSLAGDFFRLPLPEDVPDGR